jgi:hypothetical protein
VSKIKTAVVFLCACACAAVAVGGASAKVRFGVTEDAGKGGDAGVWFFSALNDIGLEQNRVTIPWDATAPMKIRDRADLDLWMPQATIHGVRVVFAVVPLRVRDLTDSRDAPAKFAAFCASLARTYPQVKDFVIGNEPNQPRFWQPQFDATGHAVSGKGYENVLARSYDALKAVSPNIMVHGIGLSPRGNDNPAARDNVSVSPTRFLRDVGAAYRASGRQKPLMDTLAFHPYPPQNTDPPSVGYNWPNIGLPDLARLKQSFWDAFHGTAQPTFAESTAARGGQRAVTLELDEVGWDAAISAAYAPLYHGTETKRPIDEQTQANYYSEAIRDSVCDPAVTSFSIFHLIDEDDLERWQSGLFRVDRSKRPAYAAVKRAIAETHGQCAGDLAAWKHTTSVIDARVVFVDRKPKQPAGKTKWSLSARAGEEALYRAGVFKIAAAKATARERSAIARTLAGRRGAKPVFALKGKLRQNATRAIRFAKRRVKAGHYVYAIRLTASMNPARAKVFIGRPIQVGTPSRKRAHK